MRTPATDLNHDTLTTDQPDHGPCLGRQAGAAVVAPVVGRPGYDGPMLFSEMAPFDLTPPRPDLLCLADGVTHLLYRGQSNVIFGAQDSGKSQLVAMLIAQEAALGHGVLWMDFEKDPQTSAVRLSEHGVARETLTRVGYWHPEYGDEQLLYQALAFAKRHRIGTLVIDSVGRALVRAEVGENDNAAVEKWYDRVVAPLVRAGLTVLLIDHTGHDRNGRPVRRPVGASAKLREITGAALYLRVVKPYARAHAGYAVLTCVKDNSGQMLEGAKVAELHATPGAGGTVFDLRAPAQAADAGASLKADILAFVGAYTRQHGRGPSKSEIAAHVKRGEQARSSALDELVKENAMQCHKDGLAHRFTPVSPVPVP